MAALRVISADSHMMEPADLWNSRLDKKFQDRAPKVIPNPKKPGLLFVAPGVNPFPVAGTYKLFGENNYMWASDYPHFDALCPRVVEELKEQAEHLPARAMRKVMGENAVRLYNLG